MEYCLFPHACAFLCLPDMTVRVCLESAQCFRVGLREASSFFPSVFQGIIDYIFYSKPQLNTLGILGPLDHHWLVENNISGCPHPLIPSDHFSLFAQLELLLPFLPQVNGIHLPGRRQSSTFRGRPQFTCKLIKSEYRGVRYGHQGLVLFCFFFPFP